MNTFKTSVDDYKISEKPTKRKIKLSNFIIDEYV